MRLSVITDEISQDLERALDVCEELGVRTVELRAIDDVSVTEASPSLLHSVRDRVVGRGMSVSAIASPFLKCHVEGDGPAGGVTHSAAHRSRAAQWDVLERSLVAAQILDAPIVRAFSFWRLADPTSAFEDVASILAQAARRTRRDGIALALENEHACNVATGEEAAWVLERSASEDLALIWDPGNEAALDPSRFAGASGYPAVRRWVRHVHLKDTDASGEFVKIGDGVIDWVAELRALAQDGYRGALSIETHFKLPGDDGTQATREAVGAARRAIATAGIEVT